VRDDNVWHPGNIVRDRMFGLFLLIRQMASSPSILFVHFNPEIDGLSLSSWQEVLHHNYDTWKNDRIVIDTANKNEKESKTELMSVLKDSAVI
jgi:hypothetical protein